jgi:hypothetical protein
MAEAGSRPWEWNEEHDRQQFWNLLAQGDVTCRMWFLAGYLRGQADAGQLDCSADPLAHFPSLSDSFLAGHGQGGQG